MLTPTDGGRGPARGAAGRNWCGRKAGYSVVFRGRTWRWASTMAVGMAVATMGRDDAAAGEECAGSDELPDEAWRERHPGPLNVIWDNAPAHRGEAVREYLRTPGLALRLVNPRFHEGRLCRATVRTSTPMRRSGAGLERRPPETCAWGPRLWCRRGSATSSAGWPAGEMKSNGAAGPSCNQGPRDSRETSSPIPQDLEMHIPPWL